MAGPYHWYFDRTLNSYTGPFPTSIFYSRKYFCHCLPPPLATFKGMLPLNLSQLHHISTVNDLLVCVFPSLCFAFIM